MHCFANDLIEQINIPAAKRYYCHLPLLPPATTLDTAPASSALTHFSPTGGTATTQEGFQAPKSRGGLRLQGRLESPTATPNSIPLILHKL